MVTLDYSTCMGGGGGGGGGEVRDEEIQRYIEERETGILLGLHVDYK